MSGRMGIGWVGCCSKTNKDSKDSNSTQENQKIVAQSKGKASICAGWWS
jgi:hypothetical protein